MNPNRQKVLDNMTKATGGKRFTSVDGSGLEGMLRKVAASLTSQYIVTFTRPGEGPAKSTTFETVSGLKGTADAVHAVRRGRGLRGLRCSHGQVANRQEGEKVRRTL